MIFRTDLALEKQEALEDASPRGVLHAVKEEGGVRVTTICIRNEKGEQALGKPKGTYVTLEMPTPEPGDRPVSVNCTVVPNRDRRRDESASITMTAAGEMPRTTDSRISAVSIPV